MPSTRRSAGRAVHPRLTRWSRPTGTGVAAGLWAAIWERTLCCKRVCQLGHEGPLPLMSLNVMAEDDAHLLHLQQ